MLTAAQREEFDQRGLLHLRGVVSLSDCDAVIEATSAEFGRRGDPDRLLDAWTTISSVRALAVHSTICDVVSELLERPALPFQTLNFETGTQQRLHADTVHFDTIPGGSMCGAWVALEDVTADAGPLQYVPGSHLELAIRPPEGPSLDVYADYEQRVAVAVEDRSAEIVEVTATKGDVILWAAGLLHGGAVVRNSESTRRSQVTHYYGEGLTYITPSRSAPARNRWFVRDPLIDIRTGAVVPQHYEGAPLRLRRRLRRDDTILAPGDSQPWPQRAWSQALGRLRARRATGALR